VAPDSLDSGEVIPDPWELVEPALVTLLPIPSAPNSRRTDPTTISVVLDAPRWGGGGKRAGYPG